jgi:FtsP/CotA-like multicopper oxidase with cupredoxin domain
MVSARFVEPPNVEMWKAPVDASGEHELILAAHRDGIAFCYHYLWDGRQQVVAPVIHVRAGEHFALRIVNDLVMRSPGEDAASTEIPPCKPMPMPPATTLHWLGYLNHTIDDRYMSMPDVDTNIHLHGFQGPADQEDIFLSTMSTPMRACEYHVTIPATQPPGTYFYHPHVHGMSDDEVAGGLSGAWLVDAARPELPYSAQHVLIVRYQMPYVNDNDYAPDGSGFVPAAAAHEAAMRPASPVRYDPFNPPPWPLTYPMRVGDVTNDPTGCNGIGPEPVVTVDGAAVPATLTIPAGQTQLFRIINGTSDSPKLFRIRNDAGVLQTMRVVGIDGVPVSGDMQNPLVQYIPMKEIMISPMGRADVAVTAPAGTTLTLSSGHFCEGADAFYQMHHDLLRIKTVAAPAPGPVIDERPVVLSRTPAARLIAYARTHPGLIRRRAITFTEYALPRAGKIPVHQAYYITDTTNPNFHEHPFWPVYRPGATVPSDPDIIVHRGDIEEWYLINTTMEVHVFHIHQMAFVIEKSLGGFPITADTAFVPVGTLLPNRRDPNYPLVKPTITRILLDFRHVPRGTFVFHCHMLFHEDHGMMATIRVE